jgi:hypothetical protein
MSDLRQFVPNNSTAAHAYITSGAVESGNLTIESGYNIQSASNNYGIITITFTTALAHANYQVLATAVKGEGSPNIANVYDKTTTGFKIKVYSPAPSLVFTPNFDICVIM